MIKLNQIINLGEEADQAMKNSNINFKPSFAFAFFLFSSLILSATQSESQVWRATSTECEFNYDEGSGRGPSDWGSLKPEWRNCSDGQMQSPINIETVKVRRELGDLRRNYRPAFAQLRNRTEDVVLQWLGNAGTITINGIVYHLANCHWHSPAEHTINGTRYPLELHAVHSSEDNKTAVIGILYQIGLTKDPFLSRLNRSIRALQRGESEAEPIIIDPESIGYPGRSYYRYNGSLTVPPCTEGVVWTIFDQVKPVTKDQVDALRIILPIQNRNNSRPIQPLNNRTVFFFHPRRST